MFGEIIELSLAGRLSATPVAKHVIGDDLAVARKRRDLRAPHAVIEADAVNQDDRRPLAVNREPGPVRRCFSKPCTRVRGGHDEGNVRVPAEMSFRMAWVSSRPLFFKYFPCLISYCLANCQSASIL